MTNPQVELKISCPAEDITGTIIVELNPDKAPESVKNFLAYVAKGYYDGMVFHRVIPGFMIQGGGFEPGMKQKKTDAAVQIEADNGLKNELYTIAMARTSDPNSATSQFFINVANNAFLNHTSKTVNGWGYTVFGKVVSGQEIIEKIAKVKTGRRGFHDDVPKEDVMIEKAAIVTEAASQTNPESTPV